MQSICVGCFVRRVAASDRGLAELSWNVRSWRTFVPFWNPSRMNSPRTPTFILADRAPLRQVVSDEKHVLLRLRASDAADRCTLSLQVVSVPLCLAMSPISHEQSLRPPYKR